MPAEPRPPSSTQAATKSSRDDQQDAVLASEPKNLVAMAAFYLLLRLGWIFKTESVIMPVFVDTIAGAGWIRGCLPVLNRFGQSLPPMLLADRLRNTRRKKWTLFAAASVMAVPFLTLSAIWFTLEEKRQPWLPGVFLLLYVLFFAANGLNQLSFGTLQGKLIRPERRGRLMAISGILGSITSITCAWFLLQRWLTEPDGGFGYIFGFAGLGFFAAALCSSAIVEPADTPARPSHQTTNHFRSAWNVFRDDREFRRAAIVGMLFITIQLLFPHFQALGLLFPHYQALGRDRLQLQAAGFDLMIWVIAQNAAVGLFSLISGIIADQFGNRLVIRLQVFAIALTPLLALYLTSSMVTDGRRFFWLVFFLLGLTPVTMKTLMNYTLELAEPQDHPRYISTMSVCLAVPFCFSPLVGYLIDMLGFEIVFVSVGAMIVCGALLTFRMSEPRHRLVSKSATIE